MATSGIKSTKTGRVILANAKYIHITPYSDENTLVEQTYDIVDIVGDTLSFTPDDDTVNAKESEFGEKPVFENVTLGKYQFAATCIDFQNEIMQYIYGWSTDENNNVYAPTEYKDKFILIEVGFNNVDMVVVAPKVKLNSKPAISSLKTGTAEGALAGAAYAAEVNSKPTPLGFLKISSASEATNTYTVKVGDSTHTFKIGEGFQAPASNEGEDEGGES